MKFNNTINFKKIEFTHYEILYLRKLNVVGSVNFVSVLYAGKNLWFLYS